MYLYWNIILLALTSPIVEVIFLVYFKRDYDNLLYVNSFSSLNLESNSLNED